MTAIPIRKTKIVATIGPASDSVDTLEEMIVAGMSVARLNLSHGSYEEHRQRIERIRQASENLNIPVAIMIDTRGVEIRTGRINQGVIELISGDLFSLFTDGRSGDQQGVSVTYQRLHQEVNPGDVILLDDGALELTVQSVLDREVRCKVVLGGVLKENKGVNLPNTQLSMAAVETEQRDDILQELSFAAENDVDYIAASFIQDADEVNRMREILIEKGVDIPIIAKIENRAGINNLEAIVAAADGIMVARGDMGVELPMADVPSMQKKIIRITVSNGKPVITATQMLASMEHNPKPTRAEASDVANAILDGSSAVMLSGESAMGDYPVEAVKTMDMLAIRTEASLREYGYLQHIIPHPSNVVTEAVSHSAVNMAGQLKAAAIISLTETGFTSRLISKHRPECPILAITQSARVTRRLCMNWGVIPILHGEEGTDELKIAYGIERARRRGLLNSGDITIATSGHSQTTGGTNLIRVMTVE
ncbi:MAG: pyruvate kinase [Candidatus Thiodiazotropha sp. (ex Ctena orbiculata)]|nr:pyruvate kinase [Candidatus Thiodiazotropha taylori]PUB89361.1 MAG: pyruvate kinase [gamma proteobacterium symbiont of Ctena orbiculata]MBT2995098.1 pyruvate kinase [Candidatus Thiodiazotropha taylori]MBT2999983.1 pyruvate kinase [Candidatus Thiodiazotropha taylori]MBV2105882.1 pyruvate kinase [Candidatus Thiodiazotropha taylori]